MVLTLSRAVLYMMLFMMSCSMHGLCEADGGGRLLVSGTAEGLMQLSVAGIRIGKQANPWPGLPGLVCLVTRPQMARGSCVRLALKGGLLQAASHDADASPPVIQEMWHSHGIAQSPQRSTCASCG